MKKIILIAFVAIVIALYADTAEGLPPRPTPTISPVFILDGEIFLPYIVR